MNQEKNIINSSSKLDKLISEMEKVTRHMNKYYSLKHSFLKGMIYGLGFVIGTTIVAGILLTITNKFFKHIPFQEAIENKIMNN